MPRKSIHKGRWPANLILDEKVAEMLDLQSGQLKSGSILPGHIAKGKSNIGTFKIHERNNQNFIGDSGGASRFFYCAKASSSERNAGLDKLNSHPCVKPISLMKYIIKLLAPPNNPTLLDPFMGSGSTLIAAKELGFNAIGIEINSDIAILQIKDLKILKGIYLMDKKIKKLQKDTKKLAKEEASLLKEDKKHDKIIAKSKSKMKGKC